MEPRYVWTADGLRLMGLHYAGQKSCVLLIHGMSGNYIENYFGHVIGSTLQKQEIGFIYAHNRGYNHINDIATKPLKADNTYGTTRLGVTYELFEDCLVDIRAWIDEIKDIGYEGIILAGHSLGCNKVIYYLSQYQDSAITGVILLSPPDLIELIESNNYQPNHKELMKQAEKLIKQGKGRQLLPTLIWDWYNLSVQTYVSLFKRDGPNDNLPIWQRKDRFEQLETIHQPILAIMGERDDIAIFGLENDLQTIKQKAINCHQFDGFLLKNANHVYNNCETELATKISHWLKPIVR